MAVQEVTPAVGAVPVVSATPDHTASFNGPVRAVAYRNGVVYVGGSFTEAVQDGVSHPRQNLAAVSVATGALLPWRPKADGAVLSLKVTRTWTYVGGAFTHLGSGKHLRLGRVRTGGAGKVDGHFRPALNRPVRSVTIAGKTLYAGGSFTKANRRARGHLAAFDAGNGKLRAGFHPRANGAVNSLVVAHKMLYAAGRFRKMNGSTRGGHVVPVSLSKGRIQKGYHSSVPYQVVNVAVTSNRIYVAVDGPGGDLRALTLKGAQRWMVVTDGAVQAVTVMGTTVYAGGHFDHVCTDGRVAPAGSCLGPFTPRWKFLAASTANGSLRSWDPQANSQVGTMALVSNARAGLVAAGGAWTTFQSGHTDQAGFALFR